jgi:hypothetical protein
MNSEDPATLERSGVNSNSLFVSLLKLICWGRRQRTEIILDLGDRGEGQGPQPLSRQGPGPQPRWRNLFTSLQCLPLENSHEKKRLHCSLSKFLQTYLINLHTPTGKQLVPLPLCSAGQSLWPRRMTIAQTGCSPKPNQLGPRDPSQRPWDLG